MPNNTSRSTFILFGLLLTFTSSFGQTFFISLFSLPIRESLELSNFEFSTLYSVATLLSAAALSWTGPAVDRLPLNKVTLLSLLGLISGALAFSFAQTHVLVLFIALFCLRQFGQGMLTLISAATMSRGFQGARGRALSLSTLGHPLGEAILPSIAAFLLLQYGLRTTWLVIVTLLLLASILIIGVSRKVTYAQAQHAQSSKAHSRSHAQEQQWTRRDVLHDIYFWMLLPMLNTAPFIITALFFHQAAIVEYKQWTTPLFAASFSIYAVMQVIGSLLTGKLIDHWNARLLLRCTLTPVVIACVILATRNETYSLWLFMGLAGLSTGAMFPATVAALTEVYGVSHIASIKSVVVSAMVFSTAISPPLVGWFLDQHVSINTVAQYLGAGALLAMILGNLSITVINNRLASSAAQ